MPSTICFQCGGDVPRNANPMVIANTTTPAPTRRAGVACQCPMPLVLADGAEAAPDATLA
jgi:hypothetical protein